jgi:hypothetical protein
MYLPTPSEDAKKTWNRALAFRPLLTDGDDAAGAAAGGKDAKAKKPKSDNRLTNLVGECLSGSWSVKAPNGDGAITLTSDKGDIVRFPANRTLMSIKGDPGKQEWDLAFGADDQTVVTLMSGYAANNDVKHSGSLAAVDPAAKPATIDLEAINEALAGPAPSIHGLQGYHAWRSEFGEALFKEILLGANKKMNEKKAQALWDTLPIAARVAWDKWLRSHPGMARMELALLGFFENGGAAAYPAVVIQANGAAGPNKRGFLEKSYDNVSAVAMLAAPGLESSWQQSILDYAGPKGRGDLFAVMDTPRYLLTKNPRDVEVDNFRWSKGGGPYEIANLDVLDYPDAGELRFLGFTADEVLDRCVARDDTGHGAAYGPWLIVDNPLSTGPQDRYVVAPPSGHVAGVIAGTDLKAGGGVHKAPANEVVAGVLDLVTEISDREQGSLNVKGINIIRHRPGAGIRVWGARTTGADPLWRYVNVRRLFLFVERSVRDAVNWAVFLPNTDKTRLTLAQTIRGFLYSLWRGGALDGATHGEAYNVKCDRENNPDVDVRNGLLTVDVMFRPPYPAEFVRIRFRQTPMEVPS